MADKLIPATPQDVQEKASPLTPEQKRKNADALARQHEAARKKAKSKEAINPNVSQEPSLSFAKGGRVTRGDGCARRGHTKGRNV